MDQAEACWSAIRLEPVPLIAADLEATESPHLLGLDTETASASTE